MDEKIKQNSERMHNPLIDRVVRHINTLYRAYLVAKENATKDSKNKNLATAALRKYMIYQKKYNELKHFNVV